MVYNDFVTCIQTLLSLHLGNEVSTDIRKVTKNNGRVLDGLCLLKAGEISAPTIYLNTYYQCYQDGMSMEEILTDILELYKKNPLPSPETLALFSDFSKARPMIAARLIHAHSNKELLKETPHLLFLDLAIVCYLCLEEDALGQISTLISHDQLKSWGISKKTLFQTARDNTPKHYPPQLLPMEDVIRDILKKNLGNDFQEDLLRQLAGSAPVRNPLYVLSNSLGVYGAITMLYENQLKNFADTLGNDLVIIPSSIHEVLLIPDDGNLYSYEELRQMVTEINYHQVPLEEQLSNQIYLYSRSLDRISMIFSSVSPIGTKNP
ncbi:MAG: DUF5688 family protein [Lachnospiraceae bacterium]